MAMQRGGSGGPGGGRGPGRGGPGGGRGGQGGGPGGQGGGQGGERGERGRGRGGRRDRGDRNEEREVREFDDQVVRINRTAAVVKGGRRFSFNALVVVGNRRGKVGVALGKANEVPLAVEKGRKAAERRAISVPVANATIPHEVVGRFGASSVLMKPAPPGTGIIAGATVRAVVELLGIRDIVTKAYGSPNPLNLVKAALDGLQQLRTRKTIEHLRGVTLNELGDYANDVPEYTPPARRDDDRGGRGGRGGGRDGGRDGGRGGRGRGDAPGAPAAADAAASTTEAPAAEAGEAAPDAPAASGAEGGEGGES
ncbi:MAG: 30S ribosomal protein S5 [Planctomycetota bacterium]